MHGNQIPKTIKELSEKLPTLDDGRIDYTHAAKAAVINMFVEAKVLNRLTPYLDDE